MNRRNFFKALGGAVAATVGVKHVPKAWASEPFRCADLVFKKPAFSAYITKRIPNGMITQLVAGDSIEELQNNSIKLLQKHAEEDGDEFDINQFSCIKAPSCRDKEIRLEL